MPGNKNKCYFTVLLFITLSNVLSTAYGQKFWLTTNEFPGGPKTGITIVNDTFVFVSTVNSIIRSDDDGKTFEQVFSAPVVYTVFGSRSGKVFAGGPGRIYHSADYGDSWDSVSLVSSYPVTHFIENPAGHLFVITGTLDLEKGDVGDGVFFSDDDGLNWSQRNSGLGNYRHCNRIAADRHGRLYLAMADEYVSGNAGFFISDNNGQTWEHINLEIDGRGAIPDKLQTGTIFGLSVSPEDSIYLSFSGAADNVGVDINLVKSISEVRENNNWRVLKVWQSVSWWDERVLNNICFARNGDWYSSAIGSPQTGATYFSKDKGQVWKQIDYGLGLDIYNNRNIQYFAEKSNGNIFMVQLLDERIYQTDTSRLTTGLKKRISDGGIRVYPNPVFAKGKVSINDDQDSDKFYLTILKANGEFLSEKKILRSNFGFAAPEQVGIYTVIIRSGSLYSVVKLVVL
ncbi:MAG: exo-alpha-sialidase [Bacteroidales bacterium]|nr:exo-alpha-sialidase [Bacteroidales bacterium]